MDIVFIQGLEVETIIGVNAWERNIRQTLVFDLEMGCDVASPAVNDDLSLALDYSAVSRRIVEFTAENHFLLIETLAHRLSDTLISEFRMPWLKLRLSKPGAIEGAVAAGVQVERGMLSSGYPPSTTS